MRNDRDGLGESLFAENARGGFGPGDRVINARINIIFDPRERQGISAEKVLPGEETGPRSGNDSPCALQDLKGREIVGLFVYMDEIRADPCDNLPHARIIVQVKVAVETKRRYNEFIAVEVGAFEAHFASLIFPGGRHDNRQFHVGRARKPFQFGLIVTHDAGFGDKEYAHRHDYSRFVGARNGPGGAFPQRNLRSGALDKVPILAIILDARRYDNNFREV